MAVSPQEIGGFMEPFAGIAVTVPVVRSRTAIPDAYVRDGCLQGDQQLREWRFERRFASVVIQPGAGFTELALPAPVVVRIEDAAMVAVGEIDLTLDQQPWVIEQRHDVPRDRSRTGTR